MAAAFPVGIAIVLAPVVFLVYILSEKWFKWRRIGKQLSCIPSAPKHWLLGSLIDFPGSNEEGLYWFIKQTERHGKMWLMWIANFPVVEMAHPDTAKVLLATNSKQSLVESPYNYLRPWLGDGLLISEGAKWARNRKLLTPAFHFNILKPYIDVYHDAVDSFIRKLEVAGSDSSIEIFEPVSLLTLDIILRCAFSYDDNVQERGTDHPYVKAVTQLAHLSVERIFNPLYTSDFIYKMSSNWRQYKKHAKFAHDMSEDIIRNRKKSLEEDSSQLNKRHLDFLDILLTARDEEGTGLADIEIRNEADTFLFEGHDTTASAISWILYALAMHPQHQRLCQQELDAVIGDKDEKKIIWEDLSKLPYLTQCIKEGMRLHSPVPFIGRDIRKPLVVDGVTIPAGVHVVCPIFLIHHNADVWGADHMEYKPERFHPDNMQKMDSHAFITFSAGPRNCIGQNFAMNEEKVVISRILSRFWLEVDEEHEVKYLPELVMRAKNGIKLRFTPRSESG